MARITRGKRKGDSVVISQMSNDWVSLTDGKIMNPTSLEYTHEEMERLIEDKAPGFFWEKYESIKTTDGRYKLKKMKL